MLGSEALCFDYLGVEDHAISCRGLEFKEVHANSFALFFLARSAVFTNEDFLYRLDLFDTLGFFNFIFFYDFGIIRWRVFFFYMRAVLFVGRWGKLFFSSIYNFPNHMDFFLIWGPWVKPFK